MSYATAAQLEEHLGADRYLHLADRDRDGAADAAAVDAILSRASSLADSYIARYLPLSAPYPGALTDAIVQIATYYLAGNAATENERALYEDALRWLGHIGAGKATLGLPEGPVDTAGAEMRVDAPDAQWTSELAGGTF